MNECQYSYGETVCGKPATLVPLKKSFRRYAKGQHSACLCSEHLSFLVDCVDRSEVEIYKMRKANATAVYKSKVAAAKKELEFALDGGVN